MKTIKGKNYDFLNLEKTETEILIGGTSSITYYKYGY